MTQPSKDQLRAQAERVIEFLATCDDIDIRSGMGAMSEANIKSFRDGLERALAFEAEK